MRSLVSLIANGARAVYQPHRCVWQASGQANQATCPEVCSISWRSDLAAADREGDGGRSRDGSETAGRDGDAACGGACGAIAREEFARTLFVSSHRSGELLTPKPSPRRAFRPSLRRTGAIPPTAARSERCVEQGLRANEQRGEAVAGQKRATLLGPPRLAARNGVLPPRQKLFLEFVRFPGVALRTSEV